MSLFVVRAFVRLRRLLASNAELARHLNNLERKYDTQLLVYSDFESPISQFELRSSKSHLFLVVKFAIRNSKSEIRNSR